MKERKMVRVVLFEDGTYEVNDADSHCTTQRLYGCDGKGMKTDTYYCLKNSWEKYLLKLINESIKDIDKKSKELDKRKKKIEELQAKIQKKLEK